MTTTTNFLHLAKDSKLWKLIHDCDTEHYVSVTCFLDFIGEGYNSRASLFKRNKPPPSSYTKLMFDYGHKNELKAKALIERKYPGFLLPEDAMKDISFFTTKGLLGSPDGFYYSEEDGGLGIIEIKCPFGNQYGQDQVLEERFEENPKRFKHWLQLQLYLHILNLQHGILMYYYPHGGENGEQIGILSKIQRDTELMELLKVDENLDLFFQYVKDPLSCPKRQKKEIHDITTERILRGITQRVRLQV